jgi:hypothetical protein
MRKTCVISLVVVLAMAWGSAAVSAPDPGVGSATTDVELLSASALISSQPQTVTIGAGSGFATTDPERLGRADISAAMEFIAAFGDGVHSINGDDFRRSAEADPDDPDSASAPDTISLPAGVADAATVELDLSALGAEVDVDAPSARSTLAEAKLDATALGGFVELQGVVAGLLNESTPDGASATQGLHVDVLSVLTVGALLDGLGGLADDLALVSDLALLAEDLGMPSAATQPLKDAQEDYAEAESDEQAWLDAIDDLGDLDLTNDVAALETIAAMAAKYVDELTGDPTDSDVVLATMALVKGPLQAAIDVAKENLASEIAGLPLLTIHGLNIGASAEATETTSTAQATISWLAAEVADHPVPTVDDIDEDIAMVTSMLVDTINIVGAAVGLNLVVDLEIGSKTETTSFDDPYQVASAEMTLISLDVSIDDPEPTSVGLKVLSLQAFAEHRPASVSGGTDNEPSGSPDDDPELGGPSDPGTDPSEPPDLANTGSEPLLMILGIGSMFIAWKLRRWLGDAA